MVSRVLAVSIGALILAGCASPTSYGPAAQGRGYGYGEEQLEPDRFRVTFRGNAVTPRETVTRNVLYRAAQIALSRGGDYFVVTERDIAFQGGGYRDVPVGVEIEGGKRGVGGGIGVSIPPGMSGPESRTAMVEIVIRHGVAPADAPDAYDARAVLREFAPRR